MTFWQTVLAVLVARNIEVWFVVLRDVLANAIVKADDWWHGRGGHVDRWPDSTGGPIKVGAAYIWPDLPEQERP